MADHLAHYKRKHVQGLYNYDHYEHPDGSFAQVSARGDKFHHRQGGDGGKMTTHHNMEDLKKHVNSIPHGGVKESVQNLDELSKKTLSSYIKSASIDKSGRAEHMGFINGIAATDGTTASDRKVREKEGNKHGRRSLGIQRAVDKLAKEEVENLDELSKSTLKSYIKKAGHSAKTNALVSGATMSNDEASKKSWKKAHNRAMGIEKAVDRLTKESLEAVAETKKLDFDEKEHRKEARRREAQNRKWDREGFKHLQKEEDMPTIRDLVDLAANGEAADFQDLVNEMLSQRAQSTVSDLTEGYSLCEDDEDENEDLDFNLDDDDDLDLDHDELTEEELAHIAENITEEEFEQLDEISKKTLASYVNKASDNQFTRGIHYQAETNPKVAGDKFRKALNRSRNIEKAVKKLQREDD